MNFRTIQHTLPSFAEACQCLNKRLIHRAYRNYFFASCASIHFVFNSRVFCWKFRNLIYCKGSCGSDSVLLLGSCEQLHSNKQIHFAYLSAVSMRRYKLRPLPVPCCFRSFTSEFSPHTLLSHTVNFCS